MDLVADIQLEVCSWLNRFELDAVQYSCRSLRRVVENNGHHLPLRRLHLAQVQVGRETSVAARNGRRLRFAGTYADEIRFVIRAIQHSKLRDLEIGPSELGTPEELSEEIAQIFIERSSTVHLSRLFLWNVVLEKLHPSTFHDFFMGYATLEDVWVPPPTRGYGRRAVDPSQVTDQFMRESGRKGIEFGITLCEGVYSDPQVFAVTDDGVLEYCFNSHSPSRSRSLTIRNMRPSRNFLHALIERSMEATHIEAISLEVLSHISLESLETDFGRYNAVTTTTSEHGDITKKFNIASKSFEAAICVKQCRCNPGHGSMIFTYVLN